MDGKTRKMKKQKKNTVWVDDDDIMIMLILWVVCGRLVGSGSG